MTTRPGRFSLGALAFAAALGAGLTYLLGSVAADDLMLQRAQRDSDVARALTRRLLPEESQADAGSAIGPESAPELGSEGAAPTLSSAERHGIRSILLRTSDGLTIFATDDLSAGDLAAFDRAASMQLTTPSVRLLPAGETGGMRTLRSVTLLRDSSGAPAGTMEVNSNADQLVAAIADARFGIARTVTIVLGACWALLSLAVWVLAARRRRTAPDPKSVPMASGIQRVDGEIELEQRIKSEFIATISHEIRTPVNAIVGMADLLKLTDLTRKQRSYMQHIQSSGDMLLSLVENVLDFARLEVGELALHAEPFDVVRLIERVLGIMGHPAYSKGLELGARLHHPITLRVSADRHRLCQILINLVANAVKYTDRGSVTIDVSASERRGDQVWLRFEVIDTGHGIDTVTRKRLFVPFASSRKSAVRHGEGSGLGLAICKHLVDGMGGTIEIESSLGLGTRVAVRIPATECAPTAAVIGSQPDGEAQLERVLIAHSNPDAADSIGLLLAQCGMECETAQSADSVLDKLRARAAVGQPFDGLILDADMTPADGLQLARGIRQDPECGGIPIVLLNSIVRPLEVGDVSRVGRLRCIDKPVLPLTLLENLRESIDSPATAGKAAGTAQGSRRTLKILVAEDNIVNIKLLLSMLETEGHDAHAASDSHQVFAALENTAYDVVLMDGRMPGMDGHRITELVRANPRRFASQPVIVAVTAEATEQYRAQCLALGMDDFITKPIRLDELRACIARWTDQQPGGAELSGGMTDSAALRNQIIERVGSRDDLFIRKYIGLFLFDTGKRLKTLADAVEQCDVATIRHQCHAIKGACLEFGAERMIRLCEKLSAAAQSASQDQVRTATKDLNDEFARLRPIYESATVVLH